MRTYDALAHCSRCGYTNIPIHCQELPLVDVVGIARDRKILAVASQDLPCVHCTHYGQPSALGWMMTSTIRAQSCGHALTPVYRGDVYTSVTSDSTRF